MPGQVIEELEGMWKMKVYDASGDEITIDVALAKSARAICDLKDRGFDYKDLLEPAWRLKAVPVLSPFSSDNYPYDPFTPIYLEAKRRLEELAGSQKS